MHNAATLYGSWAFSYDRYYSCTKTSSSLTGCFSSYAFGRCAADNHVGVWCLTVPPAGSLIYTVVAVMQINDVSQLQSLSALMELFD